MGYIFIGVKCKVEIIKENNVKLLIIVGLVVELWVKQFKLLIKYLLYIFLYRIINNDVVYKSFVDIRERFLKYILMVFFFNFEFGVSCI